MIMLHDRDRTNHMLYRFEHMTDSVARRRVFDRFLRTARVEHQHILKIESVGYDDTGRLCVVTAYPGNQEGLVTLRDLIDARGGRLEMAEATRLMTQLLETCVHASSKEVVHGAFTLDELLVDRHGCTLVELYGLRHALHQHGSVLDARSEQTRSVIEIGYYMTTGMHFGEPGSRGALPKDTKLSKKQERNWDAWYSMAMDPLQGFENAQQALDTMPTDAEQVARLSELKPLSTPRPASKEPGVASRRSGVVFGRFLRSNESRNR